MKIAVTYDDGQIFQHFGKTEKFQIFETDNNGILSSVIVDTNGQGHEALAGFLADRGVDSVICGGIGGGARSALEQAGIYVFGGVGGSPEAAVLAMLNGTLTYSPGETCGHHDHEDGHCCGRVAGNDPHQDSGQEYGCGGCEGCSGAGPIKREERYEAHRYESGSAWPDPKDRRRRAFYETHYCHRRHGRD